MKTFAKRALQLLLVIPIISLSLFAQAGGSTAEIKGRIADPNGAVVRGATVTLTDADKGTNRTAITDDQGEYRFLSLQPGTYKLKVEAAGFSSLVNNSVQVTVGQTADHDFALKVGDATAIVEVTGDPPVIETDRSQQSTTVNERFIRDLPIDRRDYLTFTLLAPGVVDSNALADNTDFRVAQTPQSGISFYGNNGRGNSITVDGAEANDQGGGVRSTLSQEAVQEFQINRANYNAELGGASGGVINIVSKTGSNDFHGSAFAYFRHQSLDAGDPFAIVLNGSTIERIKPDANRQQLGFTVGGPFIKEKLFFFGGYEGLRRRESSAVPLLTNLNIFQPTAGQSAIIASLASSSDPTPVPCVTGVTVPRANCAPILQGILTVDQPVRDLFAQNSGVFPFNTDSHSASFRTDYVPGAANSFFLRYSFTKREEDNQATRALLAFSRSNNVDVLDHNLVGGWTHVFGSSMTNELRLQGNYNELFVKSNDPNGPELNVAGFGFFNRDIFLPSFNFDRRFEALDNFSIVRGSHRMKFGGSFLLRDGFFDSKTFFGGRFGFGTLPGSLVSPQLATTTINSIQSLDLGLPQSYQQGFGDPIVGGKLPYFSIYGQDTWKAMSNLTLNYGLRYEIDGRRKPLRTYYQNWGPRVGFAWDPFKKSKTIVRGGYGIFYAQIPFVIDYVVQSLNEIDGVRQIPQVLTTINTPGLASAVNIFRTLRAQGVIGIPNTTRTITPADLTQFGLIVSQTGPRNPNTVIFRADPTYRNPRAQQASIAFEHEFAPGFSASVSYVWALTQYITRARDINLLPAPTNSALGGIRDWSLSAGHPCAAAPASCFVNPTIFQEILYESAASANYNGLIVEFQKQLGRNFALAGNYTYSKAKDQVTDYNSDFRAFDQLNDNPEYSLSAFDQRHKFVIYSVMTTPWKNAFLRDWTLTPIIRANSGRPFNLLSGTDVNGDRSTNGDRPLLGTSNATASGPIARNIGKGPAFATFDMRLTRKMRFTENLSLDLTAEAFNLLNRLNFASVNNTVGPLWPTVDDVRGNNDVGPSQPLGFTSAFGPRRIQLGVKLRF
ncbi:MAG TPA: carboxypeptidase regulatory-like domain-containing protein [Pyrinomonadaceae bacterium]|nr:carboxypeptidase regulatory-like domain-containing protein [Pyrinomonadaceae bacterium]